MRAIVADARRPCENRPSRSANRRPHDPRRPLPGPWPRHPHRSSRRRRSLGRRRSAGRRLRPDGGGLGGVRGASGACFRLDQVTLLAPVVPPKLLCIGLNYRLHAEETGSPIPTEPVVFCKLPSAYSGPGDEIVLPKDDDTPDYEAEMALVIGTRTRRADRARRVRRSAASRRSTTSRRARRNAARAASTSAARTSTRSRRSARASPTRATSIRTSSTFACASRAS